MATGKFPGSPINPDYGQAFRTEAARHGYTDFTFREIALRHSIASIPPGLNPPMTTAEILERANKFVAYLAGDVMPSTVSEADFMKYFHMMAGNDLSCRKCGALRSSVEAGLAGDCCA